MCVDSAKKVVIFVVLGMIRELSTLQNLLDVCGQEKENKTFLFMIIK